jgi:hypothetical protein
MITAGILAAMLISTGTDSAAYADSAVRQGKYVMVTGGYDKNTDLLYVVNIETQKLVVYAPNESKRTLDRMGTAVSLQPSSTPRR